MADNKDIAVLAKKVYELSTLRLDELDGRKWEALLIVNAVLSSATPDGIAKANADKESRWGDAIRKEGMLAAFHPKWLLRTDDGKPPAIKHALESALDNPNRDLRTRLQALQFIAPADREPLTDLVKALEADAYAGARGDARDQFLTVMRTRSKTWFREPWLMVLPYDGNPPPVSILIENQGPTHDGGWHDEPVTGALTRLRTDRPWGPLTMMSTSNSFFDPFHGRSLIMTDLLRSRCSPRAIVQ